MSDWMDWKGGDCPFVAGTVVDVKDRDGTLWLNKTVGESKDIDNYFWTHEGFEGNHIVAYRVNRDDLQSRTNDANLQQAFDTVQRPAHYNQSGIECIDAIAASMSAEEFQAYLKGNVQKYLWRYQHKNGLEDVLKAEWYLNRLVKELSK